MRMEFAQTEGCHVVMLSHHGALSQVIFYPHPWTHKYTRDHMHTVAAPSKKGPLTI
eukprot:m.373062 g.373062  ORF g.373062 m.373062 type:complete len:56 (-) comp65938_c0_seq1:32-199(-)